MRGLTEELSRTWRTLSALAREGLGSKLYSDTLYMVSAIRYINSMVPGFMSIGLTTLFIVFIARGVVNGTLIPYSITYVIDGLRDSRDSLFLYGLALLASSGLVFAVSEIALMVYFKRLTKGIVVMKKKIMDVVRGRGASGEDLEDLVGKIANDTDFIVWNINGVLTTLLPNIFTTMMSVATVYSFSKSIGLFLAITTLPYVLYAEVYSRRVEYYRSVERRAYAQSIVYIKNIVYGEKVNGDLEKTLYSWNQSIDRILWLDRVYWSLGLGTALVSMIGISLFSEREMREGRMDVASLAGLLSASLTAHFGMLNAMWALCVQGQTVAALKRVVSHLMSLTTARQRI